MEGVFIPSEFYKDKNLNGLERDVLALYKYYTENGKYKCCSLNSVQIAEVFNVSSRYIKRVRKHLNELGYIKTDGGINVTYIGLQVGSTVPTQGELQFTSKGTTVHPGGNYSTPQKGTTVHPGGNYSTPQKGTTVPLKGELQYTHKEEKEEKEEKKEKKREMTNLDQLLDSLPDDYKTQEIIEFIKKNYLNEINQADFSEGGVIDSWKVWLKSELLKNFTIYPVKNKPVPVKKTEDDFMW